MASSDSTPKGHLSLNSAAPSAASGRSPSETPEGVLTAIEGERTRLMRARAVLDCVYYVLLYEDHFEDAASRPSFSDAVSVARDIVSETIDALDRVNLPRSST